MKNVKSKLLLTLACLSFGLTGCGLTPSQSSGGDVSSSSSAQDDEPVSSVSESSSTSDSSSSADSSNDSTSASESSSSSEFIDYASDGSVKLNLDYAGHSFWTDGIEQVSLYKTIDGDTAHFNTTSTNAAGENLLKARFYGIDTPESTGKVQPWGKPASKYTSEILTKASKNGTIVISSPSSTYTAPSADSTGSRYVSLVWINETKKNAPYDELKLLNLMIVQNGYSWVKSVSDVPDYVDTFYAAESQAKAWKLNLFSGEDDPTFNYGGYQTVSLLDIKNEVVAHLKDDSHANAFDNVKVTVQGTVAGFANHIVYIQDYCSYVNDSGEPLYYDDEGKSIYEDKINAGVLGEYAGINIFVGMSAIPSKFTTVGNYIQVSALALESDFGFQLTSGSFQTIPYDENDAQLLIRAADNTEEHKLYTFEYTSSELSNAVKSNNYEALNCRVSVTDAVEVTGGYDSDSAHGLYISNDSSDWSVYFTFNYQPDPNDTALSWNTYAKFVGESFLFSGVLGLHTTTSGNNRMNIYPSKSSDIVWQKSATEGA